MIQRFQLVVLFFVSMMSTSVFAQDSSMTLTKTVEYDIGFGCPVASVLDPSETQIWILMNTCGSINFYLGVYNLADGSAVDIPEYRDELAPLTISREDFRYSIDLNPYIKPMAFTPDGDLSIRYYRTDYEEDLVEGYTLLIPIVSSGEVTNQASPSLDALLSNYTDYYDYAVNNHNHTQIAIWGDGTAHIIDVASETEIAEIAVEGDENTTLLWFTPDGLRLQAILDDFETNTATLFIYSLSDGELLNQYPLPTFAGYVSPDATYAAVELYSNDGTTSELVVVDLVTGQISEALNLYEDPAPLLKCANSDRDMSDVDLSTTGRFTTPGFHWLADNSTLVAAFSYGGATVGSRDSVCYFDYSRLRLFTVTSN